jgi:hypothetical protein
MFCTYFYQFCKYSESKNYHEGIVEYWGVTDKAFRIDVDKEDKVLWKNLTPPPPNLGGLNGNEKISTNYNF